jgi:hypothetical protein
MSLSGHQSHPLQAHINLKPFHPSFRPSFPDLSPLSLFFLYQTACLQLLSHPPQFSAYHTDPYNFSTLCSYMCQPALSRTKPSHSSPLSYWSTLVFCKGHWKLIGRLTKSLLFLYNPKFSQAKWLACCLLHAGFLLRLLFNPQDEGNMFLPNVC